MKDIRIDFQTAKLAKEKFFCAGNRSIFTHYHKGYTYDGDKNHPESHRKNEIREDNSFYTINGHGSDSSNKYYTLYERPTQSSLQKWLREKHNIIITITHWTKQPVNGEMWDNCFDYDFQQLENHGTTPHKTYEEALEEGLLTALKLI